MRSVLLVALVFTLCSCSKSGEPGQVQTVGGWKYPTECSQQGATRTRKAGFLNMRTETDRCEDTGDALEWKVAQ